MKTLLSALLLFAVTALGQTNGDLEGERAPISWSPFPMDLPDVAPRTTVAKEMVNVITVANWPIALETTTLTDAQRRFGGTLGVSGDAGDSLGWLCLYKRHATEGWVLWLTSSEIDGESVGGFVWLHMGPEQRIDSRCKALNTEPSIETSPIPLRLGMSKSEVEHLLGTPSAEFRNAFSYFHEHEAKIGNESFTTNNSVNIVYRNGVVWAIQGRLTVSS